jgi:hypothetical protein
VLDDAPLGLTAFSGSSPGELAEAGRALQLTQGRQTASHIYRYEDIVTQKTARGSMSKTKPLHPYLRSSLVAAAVLLSSCAQDSPTGPDAALSLADGRNHHDVASVVVTPASTDLLVGGTRQLTAKAYDADGEVVHRRKGRRFTWSSSAPNVVSVSESGRVTALAVGGPVTITARTGDVEGTALVTVSAISVAYLSGRYRYLLIGNGEPPADFAARHFEDRDWNVGTAGFGTGPGSLTECPLDATVHTIWPVAAAAGVSDLLLRHRFRVPRRFSGSARVSVAIDNDIQVFVNGVDITASANLPLVSGFAQHEGCASRGSIVFTAPRSLLTRGTNLVAVRARDRGVTSYVDLEVELVPESED